MTHGRFLRQSNVLGSTTLDNLPGTVCQAIVLRVHGKENVALLDLSFVAPGFKFRNSQSDQRARYPTHGAAQSNAAKRSHERPGGDEGSQPRNGKRAYAGKPAKSTAKNASQAGAGHASLGSFGVLLMCKILCAGFV